MHDTRSVTLDLIGKNLHRGMSKVLQMSQKPIIILTRRTMVKKQLISLTLNKKTQRAFLPVNNHPPLYTTPILG